MLKCDLTISAAGQTTYELARLGMPTIAVGVAENQKYNVQGWREIGFIKNEIWYTDVNLLEGIKEQLSTHINSNISKRKVFCDGQGARRIIEIVLVNGTVNRFYLRKFKESDARIIYELSNDDEVRKVSITQDKIDWETHINWFNKKINDSDSYYLIAHDFNNNFIGQIKFDIINQIAIVSISIHKDFRGKRFGAEILRIGCKLFFYCHPYINSIEAYIEDNNINSIRTFLKAGFDFKDHTLINQRNFNLYLFNRI
jgi:RimJ/RimL family protein N-acetyltransferase